MYIAFLMTLQHHLQSCGQVWNFGTSQPQHRGVESNGMRRAEKDDKINKTWKVAALAQSSQHSSSWRVLLQNLSIDSKDLETRHFVPMCLCKYNCTTVHATCSPISNNLLEWSIPACVLLIRQPLPDIFGPCCWPQCLPSFSRLPKYLQISSPQMSNEWKQFYCNASFKSLQHC